MRFLKTNQAVRIAVGPFISYSDGYTLKTGLTVTGMAAYAYSEADDGNAPTVRINNVSFTASGGNNDCVELAGGLYDLELTATQLNFIGRAKFMIYDADQILPYFEDWFVLPALVFDSLFKGTDNLQVDAIQCGGTTLTARDLGASVLVGDKTGFSISGTKTTLDSLQDLSQANVRTAVGLASANLDTQLSTIDTVVDGIETHVHQTDGRILGTLAAGTHNAQSGDGYAVVNSGTFGNSALKTLLDTTGIKVATNSDKAGYSISGTKQTLDALNDVSAATVNAQCDTAISDAALATAANLLDLHGDVGTVLTNLATVDGNVDAILEDTGTTLPATLSTISGYVDAIADDVLDEVIEDTHTMREVLRGILSASAGKSSGGGTATIKFRDHADTKDRITATVDADGNRTAVTLDLT